MHLRGASDWPRWASNLPGYNAMPRPLPRHGKRGPDHRRRPTCARAGASRSSRFDHRVRGTSSNDLFASLLEKAGGSRLVDGLQRGAISSHAVFLSSGCGQRLGAVERRLPAMVARGASGRSGAMIFPRIGVIGFPRFDIGGVGQIRIGHDRSRGELNQDERTPRAPALCTLRAGIIELGSLADDESGRRR